MKKQLTFPDFRARLGQFIDRQARACAAEPISTSAAPEADFDELALALFSLQYDQVDLYRRFCQARKKMPENVATWREIPAIPAVAFKEYDLSSLPAEERTTVFHSSGTTVERPSRHFHSPESLALYEASLLGWFQRHVLPDAVQPEGNGKSPQPEKPDIVALTPSLALAPHSSLVQMFETVRRQFGSADSHFAGTVDANGFWTLNPDMTMRALDRSVSERRPLIVLGTAFLFVHLLDHIRAHRLKVSLPAGSCVLETGGYKGRTRALPKAELHLLITKHLAIQTNHIVCEYGMSELSSQAYDCVTGCASPLSTLHSPLSTPPSSPAPRHFRFPPWARAQVISPETGREVDAGETGLLRVFDLANVHSVMAVQTEDLAIRRADGFEVVGRAEMAEARGCSLMTH